MFKKSNLIRVGNVAVNWFLLRFEIQLFTDKQHCLGGRFLRQFNINNNLASNSWISMYIHTNGTKSYCKENTCTGKDQSCSKMNANISAFWLKLNNTKSRRLIFVFMRFQYLVESGTRMKISFNQIFAEWKIIYAAESSSTSAHNSGVLPDICPHFSWIRPCLYSASMWRRYRKSSGKNVTQSTGTFRPLRQPDGSNSRFWICPSGAG